MKWTSSPRGALVGVTVGSLALAVLTVAGLEPSSGAPRETSPRALPAGLKMIRGGSIRQDYKRVTVGNLPAEIGGPPAAAVRKALENQPGIKDSQLSLRSHYHAQFGPALVPGMGKSAAESKLAHYEFDLLYQDVPIARASRSVVLRSQKVVAVRDRNLPVPGADLGSTEPTRTFEEAQGVALKDAGETFSRLYPRARPVLATNTQASEVPRLEVLLDETQRRGNLTWSFSVLSTDRAHPFLRHYWVAARGSARILDYEDRICFIRTPTPADAPRPWVRRERELPLTVPGLERDEPPLPSTYLADSRERADGGYTGKVTAPILAASPLGDKVVRPLPHVWVTVVAPRGHYSAVTEPDGSYSVSRVGQAQGAVVTLTGPYCRVFNDQKAPEGGGGQVLAVQGEGTGNADLTFDAKTEWDQAQLNAFYWVNTAHDFVREYLPAETQMLAGLPVHVNIMDQSGNAFWSPADKSLNFYHAGADGTANAAYRDVVCHEYGHGVDEELGGIVDGGYSEGFGDAVAILITHSPIIGIDFFGPPTGNTHSFIRDASEVHKWPDVRDNADPHEVGKAYNGFVWQLIQELSTQKYALDEGEAFAVARTLILGAAVENPKDIPDAVRLSFFVDAQLYPGGSGQPSLHYRELKAAADSRAIPVPDDPSDLTSR